MTRIRRSCVQAPDITFDSAHRLRSRVTVDALAADMFVFLGATLSVITPPVRIAAFAAAGGALPPSDRRGA